MTIDGKISAVEALQILGLYNPDGYIGKDGKHRKPKPNANYLKKLWTMGKLKRYKIGHRTIVYRKSECEALFNKTHKEGLTLIIKL